MRNSWFRTNARLELTRRDLLRGVSAGVAASWGARCLPRSAWSQTPAAALSPDSMPKGFSPAEYQRRWQKVRELMRANRFDCLIAPSLSEQDDPSDVAYLTGTGADWVVFPLDGAITSISGRATGTQKNELGVEIRPDGRPRGSVSGNAEAGQWSPAIIDSLREKGLSRARIGVGSLSGVYRNEEGGVSYTTLDRIINAFPQAQFESAVDVLMRARLVKSAEELGVIEKANAVAELGVQVMLDTARPGVLFRDLSAKMNDAMLRASGVEGSVALDVADESGSGGRITQPRGQILRAGQILNQEISGRVPAGYGQQVNHAVCIGAPAPKEWAPAAQYAIECFHTLVDWIKPGKTGKDLSDYWLTLLAKRGLTEPDTTVIFHMGDGPRMGPNRREGKDLVVEAGWVFHVIKSTIPMTSLPGGRGARFGDGVVVTASGARRLGQRKLEVTSLGA